MKKKLLLLSLLIFTRTTFSFAQTSAGKCFFIDYPSWNAGTHPPVYINCGTSNTFNTGLELTLEVWIRIYNSSWNQKIMGKVTNTFDNGYVLAMESGNYTEVWDPAHYGLTSGTTPVDSAWLHLATTYGAGGQLTEYINGVNVGSLSVGSNGLASSTNPFIIGMAPWDLISYQTFGYIDEVRVWNIERSQSDIQSTMFKHLQGNEPGLIAYYDFDQASGTTVPDVTGNGNTGAVNPAANYYSWQSSYAAIGDDRMYNMTDVHAAWFGKDPVQFNLTPTTNGLSLVSDIQAKHDDYAVFGHTDSSGTSVLDLPSAASVDFKRLNREWCVSKGGTINADMYFNLNNAAGGSDTLPVNQSVQYYTLLGRDSAGQVFTALASANSLLSGGSVVRFTNVPLENKFYTIGVGSTQIAGTSGVNELKTAEEAIHLYPNPANSRISISGVRHAEIKIFGTLGNCLRAAKASGDLLTLDTSHFENGMYFVQVTKNAESITRRFVIER